MRLPNSFCQINELEQREVVYRHDLPYLIDQEIYSEHGKAVKGEWKLGSLHEEWSEYLQEYQGINILAPRDHLKTFFFDEAYSLQQAKFRPGIKIQIYSKSDQLAIEILDHIKKWSKLSYFREMTLTSKGAELWNKKQIRFSNGSEIYANGFGSSVRGGHPDILILDDIIDSDVVYSDEQNQKAKERLASEVMPMCEPHTQIIIIGTLQREDDIYSIKWSEVLEDDNRRWISKTYDAIVDEEKQLTLYPEKWSWKALMAKRKEISLLAGEKWFDKEYRNRSINLIGEIIKPEWKRTYRELPKQLDVYTGWDLSVGKKEGEGDYTAKVTFGVDKRQDIYILSVFRERIDFSQRLRKIVDAGQSEKPIRIKVEENVFQADTVQTLKRNSMLPIEGVKTTINKVKKFNEELVPLFENGKVYLKESDVMQELFWKELCSLPRGAHDDMADAFCIGLKDLPYYNRAKDYFII